MGLRGNRVYVSEAKAEEARKFGAHTIVNSRDDGDIEKAAGSFDMVLVTANVPLNWGLYINSLRPKGRLHFVGAVLEPVPVAAFGLIGAQKQISGSPLGSPGTMAEMLEFCKRHDIKPQTQLYPMTRVNDALEQLRAGNARYRIVLQNDL